MTTPISFSEMRDMQPLSEVVITEAINFLLGLRIDRKTMSCVFDVQDVHERIRGAQHCNDGQAWMIISQSIRTVVDQFVKCGWKVETQGKRFDELMWTFY